MQVQGITLLDHLKRRAELHWRNYEPLPLDLFADMLNAGLDVDQMEREYKRTHQD
jgi:hypothetical protein